MTGKAGFRSRAPKTGEVRTALPCVTGSLSVLRSLNSASHTARPVTPPRFLADCYWQLCHCIQDILLLASIKLQMARRAAKKKVSLVETLGIALDTFRSNKAQVALTTLGMSIGTASLILVVTIGLTGKQYAVHNRIIGTNMIDAEYQGGRQPGSDADLLTIDDMNAVLSQIPAIVAASPVVLLDDRIPSGDGALVDLPF